MAVPKHGTDHDTHPRAKTSATSLVPIKVGEAEILVPRRFVEAYLSGLRR